jgi:hypothetical protein
MAETHVNTNAIRRIHSLYHGSRVCEETYDSAVCHSTDCEINTSPQESRTTTRYAPYRCVQYTRITVLVVVRARYRI